MTQTMQPQSQSAAPSGIARLVPRALVAGLVGGVVLAMIMMIVMAASGQGFWSPLNLGIAAFVSTITPPITMLPTLIGAMGITLPSSLMSQVSAAVASGHISATMAQQLGSSLMAMKIPVAQVTMMGQLMTGHATNSTMHSLLAGLPASSRTAIMGAMPIDTGRVLVGLILHMMMSLVLGVAFAGVLVAARRAGLSVVTHRAGVVGASVLGGAVVYVVMRWVLLPPTNSMMSFVPQGWFFVAHLMFGLVVGVVLAGPLTASRATALR